MTTASPGYKPFARGLHWLVAFLVIATLPIGVAMVQTGISRPLQNTLFILHKNGGVIILLFMIIRLAYRLMNPPPPLPATLAPWQKSAAEMTHLVLYVMVFFMALTGYIRVAAGGFPIEMLDALGIPKLVPRSDTLAGIAKTAHFWGRFVLVLAILAHVGAALQHRFIKKDEVFGRIWPIRPR
jgi:cytochrome b561